MSGLMLVTDAPIVPLTEEERAIGFKTAVVALTITDQASFDAVGAKLREGLALRQEIIGHFAELKRPHNEARQKLLDEEKIALAPVLEAEEFCKGLVGAWTRLQEQEQERSRQRELVAAEERQAEERRVAIAEAARSAEVQIEHRIDSSTAEEAEVLAEVIPEIIEGARLQAARSIQEPVVYRVDEQIRKPAGMSTKYKYSVRVDDLDKLLEAIANGTGGATSALVKANESNLNKLAGVLERKFSIPGCTLIEEVDVKTRKAKPKW